MDLPYELRMQDHFKIIIPEHSACGAMVIEA